ncbi:MAG: hypothetical protein PHD05_01005 [Sphaerochaetaceae bacterium]|nr:hypothetical protein [Sphaerochaetaceae bacterium]
MVDDVIAVLFSLSCGNGNGFLPLTNKPSKQLQKLITQATQTAFELGCSLEVNLEKVQVSPKDLPKKHYSEKKAIEEFAKEYEEIKKLENCEADYWEPKEEFVEKWDGEPFEKWKSTFRLRVSLVNYLTIKEFSKMKNKYDKNNEKFLKILKETRTIRHSNPSEECIYSRTIDGQMTLIYDKEQAELIRKKFYKGDDLSEN